MACSAVAVASRVLLLHSTFDSADARLTFVCLLRGDHALIGGRLLLGWFVVQLGGACSRRKSACAHHADHRVRLTALSLRPQQKSIALLSRFRPGNGREEHWLAITTIALALSLTGLLRSHHRKLLLLTGAGNGRLISLAHLLVLILPEPGWHERLIAVLALLRIRLWHLLHLAGLLA